MPDVFEGLGFKEKDPLAPPGFDFDRLGFKETRPAPISNAPYRPPRTVTPPPAPVEPQITPETPYRPPRTVTPPPANVLQSAVHEPQTVQQQQVKPQIPQAPRPLRPKGPLPGTTVPLSIESTPLSASQRPTLREGTTVPLDVFSREAPPPFATGLPMNIPKPQPVPPAKGPLIPGVGLLPSAETIYRSVAGEETIPGKMRDLVTPEGFKREQAMQTPLVDLSQYAPEDAPLIQGVAQALSSFTSPEAIMGLAGTGVLGHLAKGPFGRAVSLGFTVDMLKEFPEMGRQFREALAQQRWDDAQRLIGQMMVQGAAAGAAGAHAQFEGRRYSQFPQAREAVRGVGEFLGTRPRPAPKTGEIITDVPPPAGQRQLPEGQAFVEPRVNVEAEPIRPGPLPWQAPLPPAPEVTPRTPRRGVSGVSQPVEPTVQMEEPARPTPQPQAPIVPSETPAERPEWIPAPIEKTWLPGYKPKQLPPAPPYIEKIITEKEAAEEQRDTARREAEVDPRTGYGSANAIKRALPEAELDPNTEIASMDLANLKARNDLESPKAGDREIKAAADAVAQAAKELGIPERVFTPKGDEIYAIGPKGQMQGLIDRAVEIYGRKPIQGYENYIRGGVGQTADEADAAMLQAKGTEKGKKFRGIGKEGTAFYQDVRRVPLDDLDLEPERMQFKLGYGAKGATGSLEGVKVWNPDLEGVVLVWRDPADGRLKVLNGHNRVAKAQELGVADIPVKEIQAPDAKAARAAGALVNMAEGHGRAIDVGKFLRDTQMTPEGLAKQGVPLRTDIVDKGIALSHLGDSLFQQVITGDLPEQLGVIVGRKLENVDLQNELLRMIKGKNLTGKVVSELADIVANAPRTKTTQATLFGDQEMTESYAIQKAKLLSTVRTEIARDKTLFAKVARHAERLGQEGIQIPVEESLGLSKEAAQTLAVFDTLKNKVGIIDQILNEAAERIGKGANGQKETAEAVRRIKEALPGIISGAPEPSRRPSEGGAPAARGDQEAAPEPTVTPEAPPAAPVAPAKVEPQGVTKAWKIWKASRDNIAQAAQNAANKGDWDALRTWNKQLAELDANEPEGRLPEPQVLPELAKGGGLFGAPPEPEAPPAAPEKPRGGISYDQFLNSRQYLMDEAIKAKIAKDDKAYRQALDKIGALEAANVDYAQRAAKDRAESKKEEGAEEGKPARMSYEDWKGQQFESGKPVTVYRGSGRERLEQVYGSADIARELGPVLGPGDYYALTEPVAKKYGPNVEKTQLTVKKPLIVKNGEEWATVARAAGQFPDFLNSADFYNGRWDKVRAARDSILKELRKRGYDSIVILPKALERKSIATIFGDPQVIVFGGEPKVEPGPTTWGNWQGTEGVARKPPEPTVTPEPPGETKIEILTATPQDREALKYIETIQSPKYHVYGLQWRKWRLGIQKEKPSTVNLEEGPRSRIEQEIDRLLERKPSEPKVTPEGKKLETEQKAKPEPAGFPPYKEYADLTDEEKAVRLLASETADSIKGSLHFRQKPEDLPHLRRALELAKEGGEKTKATHLERHIKNVEKALQPEPKIKPETFAALVKGLGRDAVNDLLYEWEPDAELSPDGTHIVTHVDPRNPGKKTRVGSKEFMEWLAARPAEEAAPAEPAKPEPKVEPPGAIVDAHIGDYVEAVTHGGKEFSGDITGEVGGNWLVQPDGAKNTVEIEKYRISKIIKPGRKSEAKGFEVTHEAPITDKQHAEAARLIPNYRGLPRTYAILYRDWLTGRRTAKPVFSGQAIHTKLEIERNMQRIFNRTEPPKQTGPTMEQLTAPSRAPEIEADSYILQLTQKNSRAYATNYKNWLLGKVPAAKRPDSTKLEFMKAQAIRMRLSEILGRDEPPSIAQKPELPDTYPNGIPRYAHVPHELYLAMENVQKLAPEKQVAMIAANEIRNKLIKHFEDKLTPQGARSMVGQMDRGGITAKKNGTSPLRYFAEMYVENVSPKATTALVEEAAKEVAQEAIAKFKPTGPEKVEAPKKKYGKGEEQGDLFSQLFDIEKPKAEAEPEVFYQDDELKIRTEVVRNGPKDITVRTYDGKQLVHEGHARSEDDALTRAADQFEHAINTAEIRAKRGKQESLITDAELAAQEKLAEVDQRIVETEREIAQWKAEKRGIPIALNDELNRLRRIRISASDTAREARIAAELQREESAELKATVTPGDGGVSRITYTRGGKEVGNARLLGRAIGYIGVEPDFQRQGIGKKILADLVERGGRRLIATNPQAEALARSGGFKQEPGTATWQLPEKEPKVTLEGVAKEMAEAGQRSRAEAEAELIRQGKGKARAGMKEIKGPLFGNEEPTEQGGLFGEPKVKEEGKGYTGVNEPRQRKPPAPDISTKRAEDRQLNLFDQHFSSGQMAVRGAPGGGLERGNGVSTLGLALSRELKRGDWVDLKGRVAATQEDLAAIAQVFRNPLIEVLRFVYFKGDTIVGHEAVTIRMPNQAINYNKQKETPFQAMQGMKQRMERLGADSYAVIHNHPSRDVTPSRADRSFTGSMASRFPGFKWHIIIDHGDYSVLTLHPEEYLPGISQIGVVKNRVPGVRTKPDPFFQAAIPHALLGRAIAGPEDIANLGLDLALDPDTVSLFLLDGKHVVRAIQEIPKGLYMKDREFADYMLGQARKFGTYKGAVYYSGTNHDMIQQGAIHVINEVLLDAVSQLPPGANPLEGFTTPTAGLQTPTAGPFLSTAGMQSTRAFRRADTWMNRPESNFDRTYRIAEEPSEYNIKRRDLNPKIVAMPELVEMSQGILDGKLPKLRKSLGDALGRFKHAEQEPGGESAEGEILLRRDLFAGPMIGEEFFDQKKDPSVSVDEAFDDFEKKTRQDHPEIPDDEFIFRKDFNKRKRLYKFNAYHKDEFYVARTMAHELGHAVDWVEGDQGADRIMSRGNLLGRMAALKEYLKHTIEGYPGGAPTLTEDDRKRLRKQARREAPKGMKKDERNDWIKERYHELVDQEIEDRELIVNDQVMGELKGVSQSWKPFDPLLDDDYTKYRFSSKELYADAFSVLMNDPDKLRREAPVYYRGLMNYLERKPTVRELYDDIQERLHATPDDLTDPRIERTLQMFQEGRARREALNQRRHPTQTRRQQASEAIDWVAKQLIDRGWKALKPMHAAQKAGGTLAEAGKTAQYDLEEIQYISAEAANYLGEIADRVLKPLKKFRLDIDELGAKLMLERIPTERPSIANPLGHGPTSAKKTLEGLKRRLGPRYNELVAMSDAWRAAREDLIIRRAEESRIYSKAFIQQMRDSRNYVRFGVSKYLDETYGPGASARIFKQVGTLSGIENPFIATVLQDLAVLRFAKVNESKLSLVDVLKQIDPGHFTTAEMRWSDDEGRRVPKEPKNPQQALMTVIRDGQAEHYYVDKQIAEAYEAQTFEATKIQEIIANSMKLIRGILVSHNPVWMARNVPRDFRQSMKNLPGLRLRNVPELAGAYASSWREAWRWIMHGERSSDVQTMLRNRMLLPGRAYEAREQTFENELERQAAEFQIDTGAVEQAPNARARLKRFFEALSKFGQVTEAVGKLAGFKFLQRRGSMPLKEVGHVVRTRVATPDVKRRGVAQALTNNLFLFSNVNKEGWRSFWETFNENRSRYVWKTIATNMLWKGALAAVGAGAAGAFLKRIMDGIPEEDKAKYTVVPLWLDSRGKSIYWRLPEDYEGQYWGALAWKLAHGNVTGKRGAINETIEQVPWSPTKVNPYMQVGGDLLDYYGLGNNPTDEWRGRPIIRDLAFQAGGREAAKDLAKHSFKELGGSALYDIATSDLPRDRSVVEEVLRAFPFNVLGTFLKFSDAGIADRLRGVSQDVREKKAEGALDVQDRINRSIREAKKAHGQPDRSDSRRLFYELRNEGKIPRDTTEREFENRYNRFAARASSNPYIEAIINAQSNAEKEALLQEYRRTLSPQEYDQVLGALLGARTQSRQSLMNVERNSRRNEPQVQPGR